MASNGLLSERMACTKSCGPQTMPAMLGSMQPSANVAAMASAMFRDCRNQQAAMASSVAKRFKYEARKLQREIDLMLERIDEAASPSVICAFEEKIEMLEKERSC